METLIAGLGKAIRTVKRLTLNVDSQVTPFEMTEPTSPVRSTSHNVCLEAPGSMLQQRRKSYNLQNSPAEEQLPALCNPAPHDLFTVSRAVFSLLASAVPELEMLSLDGCCFNAALDKFGQSCPQLSSLYIHALFVPITALHGLKDSLPNLTSIKIGGLDTTPQHDCSWYKHVSSYMEAFLATINNCDSLSSLEIDFPSSLELEGGHHASWNLPNNLQVLTCSCPEFFYGSFREAAHSMSSLVLYELPASCQDVLDVLIQFPALQSLQVLSSTDGVLLNCDKDASYDDSIGSSLLKLRFLDQDFQLNCDQLIVSGDVESMEVVFSWLPALPLVRNVQLIWNNAVELSFVQHFPRIFPNMKTLSYA